MKEDKISDEISYSIHVGMCVALQHIVTWGVFFQHVVSCRSSPLYSVS